MNKDAYLIDNNKYLITSEGGNIRLAKKEIKYKVLMKKI